MDLFVLLLEVHFDFFTTSLHLLHLLALALYPVRLLLFNLRLASLHIPLRALGPHIRRQNSLVNILQKILHEIVPLHRKQSLFQHSLCQFIKTVLNGHLITFTQNVSKEVLQGLLDQWRN